jgi:hypothetical protein
MHNDLKELISMSASNRTRKWIVVIVAHLIYVIMRSHHRRLLISLPTRCEVRVSTYLACNYELVFLKSLLNAELEARSASD